MRALPTTVTISENPITDSKDMNLGKLREMGRDREAWSAAAHGFTKSQTQLSNWTELNMGWFNKNWTWKIISRRHGWSAWEHFIPESGGRLRDNTPWSLTESLLFFKWTWIQASGQTWKSVENVLHSIFHPTEAILFRSHRNTSFGY